MTLPSKIDETKLRFLTLEKAAEPIDGLCRVIKDSWWCVDTERGLIFYSISRRGDGVPQCNTNEQLARSLCAKLYPWATVQHVPLVFVRADPRDYV